MVTLTKMIIKGTGKVYILCWVSDEWPKGKDILLREINQVQGVGGWLSDPVSLRLLGAQPRTRKRPLGRGKRRKPQDLLYVST